MKETRFMQTEIGLIPEDWKIISLEEIGDPKMCKRILKHQTFIKGDIPFYKIGTFGGKADAYISKPLYEYYKKKFSFPQKGDVLISAAGTIGRLVIYQGEDAYYQDSNIVWIDNKEEKLLNQYLYYTLKNTSWDTSQGTIQRLYNASLKAKQIIIPLSINEQKKIASALTSIDNLLLSLDKLIEKKRLIKQGAMQELLTGKKRLLGFTGEWVERRLGEIGEIIKVSINPQLYRNQSFSEYSMPAYDLNKQPEIKYGEEMFSNRTKIDGTVLLYNKLNVRQRRIWYIENCKHNSICSMEFLPYKVYRDYLKFFYYKLSIDSVTNYFVGISKGTSNSQKRISPNDFLDFKVKYPRELQEQKAIATVLSSMDKEIELLEGKKAKYEQIKQGMMQQLLTGKIRLIS